MILGKKIFIGILIIILLFIGFSFWLVFEISHDNDGDEKFYNVEIPEKWNFEKPKLFLTNRQIDSLEKLHVEKNKILIIGNGYSGYDFYMWHKPTEKGELYLKAYELTQNIQLSELTIRNRTKNEITELGNEYKLFTGNTVIYEGTFENFYPTRFELWFKSESSGVEKKLIEKNYVIDGWDR